MSEPAEYQGLWDAAVFGREVENYLASPLGRYLLDHADSEIEDALRGLAMVSPWRRRKIQELQNTVRCWRGFRERLAQAIEDGRIATKALEELHEDH